jgi:hypothetical protein
VLREEQRCVERKKGRELLRCKSGVMWRRRINVDETGEGTGKLTAKVNCLGKEKGCLEARKEGKC